MHVHLIGVAGTGMGALAGLLREAGHRVTGSDVAFHPPMGDALVAWGVETRTGYRAEHLEPTPDLVVIGNVCRADNPEARAAIERGIRHLSMPGALEALFLADRRSLVVAGTHGKTTTTSLLAHVLHQTGRDPGLFVGGIPKNFGQSFRLGGQDAPFVLEGDEYDSAFFEKTPKFWRYRAKNAILTSVEHDHIDIYPDAEAYRAAFRGFLERLPTDGTLVAWAGSSEVRALAAEAPCRVVFYGIDGDDCGEVAPVWWAAPAPTGTEGMGFDLFVGGSYGGRLASPLSGAHNLRNTLAVMALAAEAEGVAVKDIVPALASFAGVKRRQELLGIAAGVRVYDDFAHHPTAVRETLRGLRDRHPEGKLLAAFEPRSATACRRVHQAEYPDAFAAADVAWLAPVGRPEIDASEKLDVTALAETIRSEGRRAEAPTDLEALLDGLVGEAVSGDTIVLMSNGPFGGLHDRLLARLANRARIEPADR